MSSFAYNLDLTGMTLYSSFCSGGGFPSPRVCDAILQDAANAYIHYAGWNVGITTAWRANVSLLALTGAADAVLDSLRVEYDCHFVPDDTIDSTGAPDISVEADGRHSGSASIQSIASLSEDLRDETVHSVVGTTGSALLGEAVSDGGVDVAIDMRMSGGHAVAGSGPYAYISNVKLYGTWHPLAGGGYEAVAIDPEEVTLTVGATQEFTTNKPSDWLLSDHLDPDPDGAHDGTNGTWLLGGNFTNDSGGVDVAVGKASALYGAPLVPGTYYLYVWDSGDA